MYRRTDLELRHMCATALGIVLLTISCSPSALVHPIKPEGNWELRSEGEAEGATWKFFVAPGCSGGTCVSVATEPPLVGSVAERGVDSGEQIPVDRAPLHKGKRAACVPTPMTPGRIPPSDSPPPEPLYVVAVDSRPQAGPGPHILGALVVETASDIVALFSDGSQQPVQPKRGTIVPIWRGDRRLDHFEFDAPGYAFRLRCGGADDAPMPLELGGMSCYTSR